MVKQHERAVPGHVVPRYEIDTLGAPFKVTLLDGVIFSVDPKTGKERINFPDGVGLIAAVVRARVSHPRKMNGKELRFVRNALGLKARPLSKFLSITPEHLSRCEAGDKVMSAPTERNLRLFAFMATYFPDPQELLDNILEGSAVKDEAKKPDEMAEKFVKQFLSLKIRAAFDTEEELNFEFRFGRKPKASDPTVPEEWENEPVAAAACG